MPEQPEYSEAGEVFNRSMREALEHLDKLSAEVTKAKEDAIDQEIAAKEELHKIQLNAEKLSEQFIEQHQKEYDQRVINDTMKLVVEKLIRAGRSSAEIKAWLDVTDELIARTHTYLGFELLDGRPATVMYESQGRAGNVYFNWDGVIIVFPYEFTGGNSLATIDIPVVDQWETKTGLKSGQRNLVLDFIAKRVVRDQAPSRKYEIQPDQIRIY